ncbi:hypothetical protein RN001_011461 [Aquatica leii]|uniref:PIH1 domain-containing protein 1 n=1 Tax=Aquatica leii TaxID=1421715 RepID=A0AAN7SEJ7_9COLE|nr:hypothetical protein RN001_011461 [Aquatica leii]
MSPKPVFLDVDSTIVERNLRITKNEEEEFNKFLTSTEEYPSKLIKPIPGFCIKTKEVGTDTKVFVNICQTDALPPPEDLSESELTRLCDSDEPCNFRIPLSIGEVRVESDKKGVDAKAIDVAINPKFFLKIENTSLFKSFFLAVVFEGLSDKHHMHVTDERIVLKNRKAYGNLQLHRIQQREIDEKINAINNKREILLEPESGPSKPKIEVLSSTSYVEGVSDVKTPEYRLFKKLNEVNVLYGEFKLPNLPDANQITLDVGEDRIVLESKKYKYFLDVFLPCDVSENVIASFDTKSKILTIKMSTKST